VPRKLLRPAVRLFNVFTDTMRRSRVWLPKSPVLPMDPGRSTWGSNRELNCRTARSRSWRCPACGQVCSSLRWQGPCWLLKGNAGVANDRTAASDLLASVDDPVGLTTSASP